MVCSRRRLCAAVATIAVATSGCLDGSNGGTDEAASDDGRTGDPRIDDWEWSGSLPVTSAVQHHDPSCGCCSVYVEYLESNGLDVTVEETGNLDAIKADRSIPEDAWSCHTVEIGDYLVEGHVPLEAIETLFETDPDVAGVSAPGMPQHAPGMGARGDDPLPIYAFDGSGNIDEFVAV